MSPEPRPQTFIFADLAGFTTLTEAVGDERAADLALAFCTRVCELNDPHDAEEVKMIGDACMIRARNAGLAVELVAAALSLPRRAG